MGCCMCWTADDVLGDEVARFGGVARVQPSMLIQIRSEAAARPGVTSLMQPAPQSCCRLLGLHVHEQAPAQTRRIYGCGKVMISQALSKHSNSCICGSGLGLTVSMPHVQAPVPFQGPSAAARPSSARR